MGPVQHPYGDELRRVHNLLEAGLNLIREGILRTVVQVEGGLVVSHLLQNGHHVHGRVGEDFLRVRDSHAVGDEQISPRLGPLSVDVDDSPVREHYEVHRVRNRKKPRVFAPRPRRSPQRVDFRVVSSALPRRPKKRF